MLFEQLKTPCHSLKIVVRFRFFLFRSLVALLLCGVWISFAQEAWAQAQPAGDESSSKDEKTGTPLPDIAEGKSEAAEPNDSPAAADSEVSADNSAEPVGDAEAAPISASEKSEAPSQEEPRVEDGSQLGDNSSAGRGRVLAPTVPIFQATFQAKPQGARVFLGPVLPKDDGYGSGAWQRRMEADEFTEICTAPCEAPVYPGQYRFALAPEEGGPIRARGILSVEGDTVVSSEYTSHRLRRIAGWMTMVASVVGGSVMTFAGVSGCDGATGSCVRKSPLVWLGTGVFLLGTPTGLWLTLNDDQVSFSIRNPNGKK